MRPQAVLALADGSVFHGESVGVPGRTEGEVVFNTAMSGYQEILTDPSYHSQIITFTTPHIGNVGVNPGDRESVRIHAAGLVVRELSERPSSWRSRAGLGDWLAEQGKVGIAGVDTRALTAVLRSKGALNGAIVAADEPTVAPDVSAALELARGFRGIEGADLASLVSTPTPYAWQEGRWELSVDAASTPGSDRWHVVVYDFGVKHNILRMLADRGCRVTVVPSAMPLESVTALGPNGVFLSNGPGDPAACGQAIATTRAALAAQIPVFGVCLGHQILALACGADTEKMKFGHHGANHPVQELATGRVFISSQNHGFAVADKALPAGLTITHRSLFDGSIQGLRCTDAPAFGFQGHPEASPGPHDLGALFDRFVALMAER